MEKIVKTKDYLALKVVDMVCYNPEWLINPFGTRDNGAPIHFGTFSFIGNKQQENIDALKSAVKMLEEEGAMDTVFDGKYPKVYEEENYGWKIKTSTKTNFYDSVDATEPITDLIDIESQVWDLEIHLSLTQRNEIFLSIPRAIKSRKRPAKQTYEDSLFSENETVDENDIFL